MIYLYVKTHTHTGLQYLGKTSATDPHKYAGSGKYWKLHLRKHGSDHTTTIIFESENPTEIKEKGIYFSRLWDVVKSDKWANLKEEQGDGGAMEHSPKSNQKRSDTMRGRIFTEEHRQKLSIAGKGHADNRSPESLESFKAKTSLKLKGRKFTEEHKANMRGRGQPRTDEQKANMKAGWSPERKLAQAKRRVAQNLARPILTCPHCGKSSSGNMHRYHFANCKCLQVPL